MLMGPNTLSGHLSVIYTTECQINFTIRIIRPILNAIKTELPWLAVSRPDRDIVTVKPSAEKHDIEIVQQKAKKLVWATGCTSWFIDENTKRNTIMFPDWQYKFWLRSIFVSWDDFAYRTSGTLRKGAKKAPIGKMTSIFAAFGVIIGVGAYLQGDEIFSHSERATELLKSWAGLK
jgi:hypothetical protein